MFDAATRKQILRMLREVRQDIRRAELQLTEGSCQEVLLSFSCIHKKIDKLGIYIVESRVARDQLQVLHTLDSMANELLSLRKDQQL